MVNILRFYRKSVCMELFSFFLLHPVKNAISIAALAAKGNHLLFDHFLY
jgi:hypothetical protein